MRLRIGSFIAVVGVLALLGASAVRAGDGPVIDWWVLGGGGGAGVSGAVVVNDTLGQPVVGEAGASGLVLAAGYWYGAPQPLAVDLAAFGAEAVPGGVRLTWMTESEQDVRGFRIYRAAAGGDMTLLTPEELPARSPGALGGQAYTWDDPAVVAGRVYVYSLGLVRLDGRIEQSAPVEVRSEGGVYLPLITG